MANLATINNNILADSGIDPISVVLGSGTANQIAYWIDADNIGALTTVTYPSLTELSYVKGVTSAIQTQIDGKLSLSGGTMTGNINWAQTDRGITWVFNTDGAYIKFYNTGDGDTDSRLEFATIDNNNEYFRWGHVPSGGSFYESMKLVPVSSGNAELTVSGKIIKAGGTSSQYLMADGSVSTLTNPVTGTGTTGTIPKWTSASAIGNSAISDDGSTVNIASRTFQVTTGKSLLYNVAIGGTATGTYAAYADSVVGIGNLHLGTTSGAIYINSALALPTYINPVGGSVGINTTSPGVFTLNVNGTIKGISTFSTYVNDGLFSADARPTTIEMPNGSLMVLGYYSGGNGIYYGRIGWSTATEKVSFGAAATNTFRVGVGIGDTEKFTVNSSGIVSQGYVQAVAGYVASTNGTINNEISYSGSNGLLGTTTSHGLLIRTNATTAVTIDTAQNVAFANNIGLNNTKAIYFATLADENWKIYRSTAPDFTRSLIGGFSLNINAHYADEGFAIGANGGNSYYEVEGTASGTSATHFFRGLVGMNTASPADGFPLTIQNNGANLRLRNTTTRYRADFAMQTAQLNINAYDDTAGSYMPIQLDASTTILGMQGNVGIGTASPSYKLDVSGIVRSFVSGDSTRFVSTDGTVEVRLGTYTTPIGYVGTQSNHPFAFYAGGTERMRLDASGNLGLGVSPSAWRSAERALQIGATTSLYNVFGITLLGNNYFTNSSNQSIYINSAFATYYWQSSSDGSHQWAVAPSGTAGNAISFTQAMTLDASGRLGIGTTSLQATYKVTISGTDAIFPAIYLENTTNSQAYSIRATGTNFVIRDNTSGNDRFTIASTGAATFSSSVKSTRYLIAPSGTSAVYNFVDADQLYAGSYNLQAGEGSAGYGGSLVMYGHSHATKAGYVIAGISAGSGGKFTVNNGGNGSGTEVFTVDVNGAGVFSSSVTMSGTLDITTESWVRFLGNNVLLADGDFTILQASGTGLIRFRNNSAQNLLTLANNGAATFSNSVSVVGLNLTSTYASKIGLYNSSSAANMELGTNTSTNGAIVSRLTSYNTNNGNSGNESSSNFMGIVSLETQLQGTNGGNFILKTKGDGGTLDTRFTIASTGAATFSNNVSAGTTINWYSGIGALSYGTGVITMETNSANAIQFKTNGSTAQTINTNQTILFANNIGVNNTYGLLFNGLADNNWKIYRTNGTPDFARAIITGPSLNINAHYNSEGFAIGANGGNSYYEILGNSAGTSATHYFRGTASVTGALSSASLSTGAINGGTTNIGLLFFSCSFSTYTTDGLFSPSALYSSLSTPGASNRVRFGYNDYGGGQYYGAIGFDGPTQFSIGHRYTSAGTVFGMGTGYRGNGVLIDSANAVFIPEKLSIGGWGANVAGINLRGYGVVDATQNYGFILDRGTKIGWTDGGNASTGEYIYSQQGSPYSVTIHSGGYNALACPNTGHVYINYEAGTCSIGSTSFSTSYKLYVTGTTYSSGGFFEASDIRLKDIVNTHEGFNFGAIEFRWNDGRDNKLHWGYAAQEVLQWIPDAVINQEDGYLSLDYNQVHTYKIAMLEKRIAELEQQLKNK